MHRSSSRRRSTRRDPETLTRAERETISRKSENLYNGVFQLLDTKYGGDVAGRVATATQKAFERALARELA